MVHFKHELNKGGLKIEVHYTLKGFSDVVSFIYGAALSSIILDKQKKVNKQFKKKWHNRSTACIIRLPIKKGMAKYPSTSATVILCPTTGSFLLKEST